MSAPKMVYIYKLVSPNSKIYIGQSTNINIRFSQYKHNKCKGQPKLYFALKKYGWNNFTKEILEYVDIKKSDDSERFWISYFNTVVKGLNCEFGGRINKMHCEKTKNKMRNSHVGKKISTETKLKIGNAMRGKKHSVETKQKISIANTGKLKSIETIEKMKQAHIGKKLPPRSKEHCEKISKFKTGQKHSIETRKKISHSLLGNRCHFGKKHTNETKLKIRNKKLGHKHSIKTKEKIKKSMKIWHIKQKMKCNINV